jgi:hypothetical protein
VETSAGESLISMRPFAVTKWSAWLVSKESPVPKAPSPVTLKSATVSHPTLLSSSPYNPAHKKTLGLQTPSFPTIMGRLNNVQEYQVRSATGGQWAATNPRTAMWPTTKHSMVLPIYHTDYNRDLEMSFPLCPQYTNWSRQTGSWVTSNVLTGQTKCSVVEWEKKTVCMYSKTCLKRNAMIPVFFFRFHRFPFYKGLCFKVQKIWSLRITMKE